MVTQPGTEGFLSSVASGFGGGLGRSFGGKLGGAIGGLDGNWFGGKGNRVGANSSPYGDTPKASPNVGGQDFQLPNFLQGQRGY